MRTQLQPPEEELPFLQTNRGYTNIRVWHPPSGQWVLTRLGERYYWDRPSEYIISIPVRYDIIRNRDGAEIFYKGYMPVTQLSANLRAIVGTISAQGERGHTPAASSWCPTRDNSLA